MVAKARGDHRQRGFVCCVGTVDVWLVWFAIACDITKSFESIIQSTKRRAHDGCVCHGRDFGFGGLALRVRAFGGRARIYQHHGASGDGGSRFVCAGLGYGHSVDCLGDNGREIFAQSRRVDECGQRLFRCRAARGRHRVA